MQLQKETTRADQAERIIAELQDEHQAACDLARSKDQLLELGQAEIIQLRESLRQATAQEEQGARWDFNLCFFLKTDTIVTQKCWTSYI